MYHPLDVVTETTKGGMMEIVYHQEPDANITEVGFRIWDFGLQKKFYLTGFRGNYYVPEGGVIPEACQFYLSVSVTDFEDAVLELAEKIKKDRLMPEYDQIKTTNEKGTRILPGNFTYPEPGNWKCYLFGGGEGNGMIYFPTKKSVPNWFWRKMQYLCFGNRWVRVEK